MSWEAWATLVVVGTIIVLLVRDVVPTPVSMLGGTVVLLVLGILTPEQAFAGFSNPAPITVAALYVLARGVEVSGVMEPVVGRLLGAGRDGAQGSRRSRRELSRLVFPVAAGSAVLNNTPIVATIAPEVLEWARRRGVSSAPLLMPLSFAAILGGTITVIGTSTNLVVSGLLQQAGDAPIGMFEITRVGLPVALAGCLTLVVTAGRLLPDRGGRPLGASETVREFSVTMRVVADGPLDGRTLEGAGLRNLQGVYCVRIDRDGETIAPVAPTQVLLGDDVLYFVGQLDLVVDLHRKRGLRSSEHAHVEVGGLDERRQRFYEAVIGADSPLVGRTLKDVGFRGRYAAAVLAIHRAGQRLDRKLGDVHLRVGDTLLLLAEEGFRARWRETGDFLVIAPLGGHAPTRPRNAALVGLITAALIVVAGLGIVPVLEAALVAAFALVALRVLTVREARNAVDLNVIVVIAAAFGLASALETTGLADGLASAVVDVFAPLGPLGALLGVLVATCALTELVTNNAAAALMFPIAMATASSVGANPRPFVIGIAVAASASFLTPIGYQTNTMVYGLGGYRFTDYLRLGSPLLTVTLLTMMATIPLAWPL